MLHHRRQLHDRHFPPAHPTAPQMNAGVMRPYQRPMRPRDQLIARLSAQPEPPLAPIEAFLEGNEDLGSIGCNLPDHPGMAAFRAVFARLAARPDVDAIYAQIAELDPGDDCWPFADTVYVVGSIPGEHLGDALAPLQPDEVSLVGREDVPPELAQRYAAPIHVAWWD